MNALDGAGYCHLYGISSVLSALESNRRDFTAPEDVSLSDRFDDANEDDAYYSEEREGGDDEMPERKPEAQFRPWLFVQDFGFAFVDLTASAGHCCAFAWLKRTDYGMRWP